MFLARFFSSEGMDLFPDQYLFKWQHFLYLGICFFLFFFSPFLVVGSLLGLGSQIFGLIGNRVDLLLG